MFGFFLSERPGSNRRQSAWKAEALPTELLSQLVMQIYNPFIVLQVFFKRNLIFFKDLKSFSEYQYFIEKINFSYLF